ncbi:MAG: FkbM family methyltransferase [Candidatus Pristimantibacillus sp.]
MSQFALKRFASLGVELFGESTITTIVEIGARDCDETLLFHALFPHAKIYAFECNPYTIPVCRNAVQGIGAISLVEKAASSQDGTTSFYPINPHFSPAYNPGASSLYKASGKYPLENYVQKEVVVDAISLKTFMKTNQINRIDLLWMDIQGAELLALQGLHERIKDVKIIHLEIEFFEIYKDQPLFDSIHSFMSKHDFLLLEATGLNPFFGDVIYINQKFIMDEATRNAIAINSVNLNKYLIDNYM